MSQDAREGHSAQPVESISERRLRPDAQRKMGAILEAAFVVFANSGVDAPVRLIAKMAGVGSGTIYRHFPQRSDLIAAVFRSQIDACVTAALELSQKNDPLTALTRWLKRYSEFIATKRGLGNALHSGEPAYEGLMDYFKIRLCPTLKALLEAAEASGQIREGVNPDDLLIATANLCHTSQVNDPEHSQRMIALLIDGIRFGAKRSS